MNIFKKIDHYLLHHYPSVWITRVHYFLPIGIGLVVLLFLGNMAIGWNPKEDYPSSDITILLMIIPVLVYLVYWFIFQSRYNVLKSGGKMSLFNEYLNYFLYLLVFFVAFLFILVVPMSNQAKLKREVPPAQLEKDIKAINQGVSLVSGNGTFEILSGKQYRIAEERLIYDWYESYDYREVVVSEREALKRIENYIKAHNKYTYNTIEDSPQKILAYRIDQKKEGYDYDYYGRYEMNWELEYKLSRMKRIYHRGWLNIGDDEGWFWKVTIGLLGLLALLVWIFKQMNLRHFVFGFITLCLTPLLVGIAGAIIFEVLYRSGGIRGERVALNLALITYIIVGIVFIRGYLQSKLNQTAYVLTMYFHFFVPLIPLFAYLYMISGSRYYYGYYYERSYPFGWSEDEMLNVVYWSCVALGLISLAVFKPIYAKFRSLPAAK